MRKSYLNAEFVIVNKCANKCFAGSIKCFDVDDGQPGFIKFLSVRTPGALTKNGDGDTRKKRVAVDIVCTHTLCSLQF